MGRGGRERGAGNGRARLSADGAGAAVSGSGTKVRGSTLYGHLSPTKVYLLSSSTW